MPFFPSLPDDATSADILCADPDYFGPFVDFTETVMRGPSALSEGQRELLGAYVSGLNECQYCAGGHSAAAAEFGIDPALFDAIMADVDTAALDEELKPLFRFVRKLTLEPAKMTEADADAVFAAGWPETALRDAICVAGCFNFMNRVIKGHGIAANPDAFAVRGKHHAEHGYRLQFRTPATADPSSGGRQ